MRREETKRAKAKKKWQLDRLPFKEHFFLFFGFSCTLETLQMNDKGYIQIEYVY